MAVIYTDAFWNALTDIELQNCIDICKEYNIQFYAIIYSNSEAELPNGIKSSLKALADASGGILYDGITSSEAAKDIANKLQQVTQGVEPCSIEWLSGPVCFKNIVDLKFTLKPNNIKTFSFYRISSSANALP